MSIPNWSFSSIKTFELCPRKYYGEKVSKEVPKEDTDATLYGTSFHLAAEEFIRDDVPLPEKFKFALPALQRLKNMPGEKHCEIEFGVARRDGQLVPCEFDAPDVWFRGIADLLIINGDTATLLDYKTSKSAKYADTRQLALMAACTFMVFPHVKVVKAGLLFVVCNALVKEQYTYDRRFDIFGEMNGLLERREVAHETGVFNPNPNGLCRKYCGMVSCAHNGKYT